MVKKILLGLLGIIVLLIIVGFFLPSKFEITKSMSINAPAEYAFEEVNALENWNSWSYWNSLDPKMKIVYGDVKAGVGSFYSWEGEEVGKGKLTITESLPFKSIKVDLDFMEQGTAKAWYDFEPDQEGTKVTMGFATDFGWNPFMRWLGATMFPSEMNKAFDYNFSKIKSIAEAKPKFSIKITEEDVTPISYIGLNHTMSPKDGNAIAQQMGKMYGEIITALKKAKVETTGYPFCLFPSYSEESMDMVCAIPVAANAKISAKYPVMQTSGGKALKAVHKGTYQTLENTHNEINRFIEFKNLEINGAPWEVYVTDPTVETDTSKWITEVYYPVKN